MYCALAIYYQECKGHIEAIDLLAMAHSMPRASHALKIKGWIQPRYLFKKVKKFKKSQEKSRKFKKSQEKSRKVKKRRGIHQVLEDAINDLDIERK